MSSRGDEIMTNCPWPMPEMSSPTSTSEFLHTTSKSLQHTKIAREKSEGQGARHVQPNLVETVHHDLIPSNQDPSEQDRFRPSEEESCVLCDEQSDCPTRYEILAPLGQGVYGDVYKCVVKDTRMTVAMKISRSGKSYVAAAKRELRILKILKGQSGVVKYQDAFEHLGHICIVLDLHGMTLKAYLKQNGPLPQADVLEVAAQLFSAVEFVHRRAIVHTDIKPDNVVLVQDPSAREGGKLRTRLIDFSSSIFETQWHPPIVGTPEYRAPECDLHAGWSQPMDVWSVGCLLYELRSGDKLYRATLPLNIRLRTIELVTGKTFPDHVLRAAYKRRKRHADETLRRDEGGEVHLTPLNEEDARDAQACADVILSALSDSQDFRDLFLCCIEPDPLLRMKASAYRKHAFFKTLRLPHSDQDAPHHKGKETPAQASGASPFKEAPLGQLDGMLGAAKQYVAEVLEVTQVTQAVKNLTSLTRWL